MKYLTPQQVLAIHDQLVKRFGGSLGLRDLGLLESAIARPRVSFDGEDLYSTIFDKAAALLHSILKNHPFVNGNKRTALASAGLMLKLNGCNLLNKHKDELDFALKVEKGNLSLEEIAKWLEKNSEKST